MTADQLRALYPRASDSFIRANADELRIEAKVAATLTAPEQSKRVRQRTGARMNKTETALLEHLTAVHPGQLILPQFPALPLANGVKYTPDFCHVAFTPFVGDERIPITLTCYEAKGGHMWEDAIVKLKVAAHAYPWIRFALCWRKGRTQAWQQQHIFP